MKRKENIGLLGGSFNPPHGGHIEISKLVYEYFEEIDKIWWIVALQNHLKSEYYFDFENRYQKCIDIVNDYPFISVLNIEQKIKKNLSYDVVEYLLAEYDSNFYWIMGSDSILQIDQWQKGQEFLNKIGIICVNRHYADLYQLIQKKKMNINIEHSKKLTCNIPNINYIINIPYDISSTHIRKELGIE